MAKLTQVAVLLLSGCVTPNVPIAPSRFQHLGKSRVLFTIDTAGECMIGNAVACTMGSAIILPDPCEYPQEYYARIVCHENGHRFGGWKHEKQ